MKIYFEKIEYYSILLAASAIIVFIFTSIVLRYVFNIVFSWPDELSRFLQIYIIWMGASLAYTRNRVLKIDLLNMLFKDNKILTIVADVITLIGTIILFVAIFKFTYNKFLIMETSMILSIPLWIVGLAISLSVLSLVIKICMRIKEGFVRR
jgi:TRAP-type C4-dicarboxylate transport system permease small subunit